MPEELEKVANLSTWRMQIELLQPAESPGWTPTHTPSSVSPSAPTRHAMDARRCCREQLAHERLARCWSREAVHGARRQRAREQARAQGA